MQKVFNRTLKVSIVFVTLALLVTNALAQAGPGAGANAEKAEKLAAIAKQLQLTPQQEQQLMPILKADAPKIEAIKNNPSLGPLQKMEQIRAIHAQSDPQIKTILNPQQYQQLQQIRQQEIHAAMQEKMGQQ